MKRSTNKANKAAEAKKPSKVKETFHDLLRKPFRTDGPLMFHKRMDDIWNRQAAEFSKAVEHIENATMLLELFASTARNDLEATYYSFIPYGERLREVQLYTVSGKMDKPDKDLDEKETAARMSIDILMANFFPEEMHKGLKFTGIGYFGERIDHLIFKFSWKKEEFELWTPNLDALKSQGIVFDAPPSKLDLYDKLRSMVVMSYNRWETSMYHIEKESCNVTTMNLLVSSHVPVDIRNGLSKWLMEDYRK